MSFIGIISDRKKFNNIRNIFNKNANKRDMNLININKNSIENLKNIKYELIIIFNEMENFKKEDLMEVCINAEYIILNSDIELKRQDIFNIKSKVITFGLNQKSSITFSSITDENLLISVQRDFLNIKHKLIEVGDYTIKINRKDRGFLNEILAVFIINKLYID